MTKEFAIVYDLGGRGCVYVSTLTQAGAEQLFRTHFPQATVVRVSEVK